MFAQDNSAKSLLADERMSIGSICGHLAAKNHIELDTSLCIIEHMPQLYMGKLYFFGRVFRLIFGQVTKVLKIFYLILIPIFCISERFYEDHESLVENVLHWGRDTTNKLYFMQRSDKYDLFRHP